jgi:hypothetical protein
MWAAHIERQVIGKFNTIESQGVSTGRRAGQVLNNAPVSMKRDVPENDRIGFSPKGAAATDATMAAIAAMVWRSLTMLFDE